MTKATYTTRVVRTMEIAPKSTMIDITLINDLLNQVGGTTLLFKKKTSVNWYGNVFRSGKADVLVVPKSIEVGDYFDTRELPGNHERDILNKVIALDGVIDFSEYNEARRCHIVKIARGDREFFVLIGSGKISREAAIREINNNAANFYSASNYENSFINGFRYNGALNKALENKIATSYSDALTVVVNAILEVRASIGQGFVVNALGASPQEKAMKAITAKKATLDDIAIFSSAIQETPMSLVMVAERLLVNSNMGKIHKGNQHHA